MSKQTFDAPNVPYLTGKSMIIIITRNLVLYVVQETHGVLVE
jgi:hypothetical protein